MRCEEARPLLLRGPHETAEAHLEACTACFDWLEQHDPMVAVLQAARPAQSAVPAGVAALVLERWKPQRISVGWGIAAAVALSLIGLVLAAVVAIEAPALIASLLAGAGSVAVALGGILLGLLAVPRALILDEPGLLAGFVLATILVCALWARLYYQTQIPRRLAS
ncbi:MAG TPA: hypothetical protein VET65_10065 [Candidatus Limnocylindrales bacterium]|nr:hypothetical protein [Candidatus Limnocylindrales bacterium]